MLEDLSAHAFSALLGQTFNVVTDVSPDVAMELIAVRELQAGAAPEAPRTPFSIVFRGPPEPLLPQRIYRFEHPELDTVEIFIVPIGRDQDGVRYEAVFN